ADVHRWAEVMQRRAHTSADPINPELVFHELSPRLPDDAIVAADSGSAANWYARHIRFRGDMRGSLSGTLATMGPGVPYVIGAKFGHPDRPGYALVGDGAMQMNGINELITIAKYWRDWSDPRLVVAVLHNNDLNQVTWELRAMGGSPQFLPSQRLPDFPYAAYPRSRPRPGSARCRGEQARGRRTRLGGGVGRGPALRGRVHHRSRGATDSTARDLGPDREGPGVDPARRHRPGRHDQGRRQVQGPGVPSWHQGRLAIARRRRFRPGRFHGWPR